jgi:hypothetical protein
MKELTREDVQSFLEQFHTNMKIFGIIYRDDRGKNQKSPCNIHLNIDNHEKSIYRERNEFGV